MPSRSMVAALVLALTACGSNKAEEERAASPPPDQPHATASTIPAPPAAASNAIIAEETIREALKSRSLDHWYGLYMAGKKLGYARLQQRPTRAGEAGAYIAIIDAVIVADGAEMNLREGRHYAGAAPYRLVELTVSEDSGAAKQERRYLATPDGFAVATTNDGVAQPARTLPASEECLAGLLAQFADPASAVVGKSATVADFDVDNERDEITTVTVAAITTEPIAGVAAKIAVLTSKSSARQVVTETRIASGGVALLVAYGAIVLKLEDQDVAQSQVEGFDMVEDAVTSDRPLGEPDQLTELALVVTTAAGYELPSGPNQQVDKRNDGSFAVVIKAVPGAAASADERREALAPTHEVDFRAPEIASTARTIIGDAEGDRAKVSRLIKWVYANLDKTLTSNVSTATQVLARKAGDCTEHSLLFTALARAVGVPARRVGGLVYMGDEVQRFGWHEWSEVILDDHWVQVDPSWNEEIANPTHLRMDVGNDANAVMTMGAMKISVVSVK